MSIYYLSADKRKDEVFEYFKKEINHTAICFSIVDEDDASIMDAFKRALDLGCDFVEWRADLYAYAGDNSKVIKLADEMLKFTDIFIVTDIDLSAVDFTCAEIGAVHGFGEDLYSSLEEIRDFMQIEPEATGDVSAAIKSITDALKGDYPLVKLAVRLSEDPDEAEIELQRFKEGVTAAKKDMSNVPLIAIAMGKCGKKARRLNSASENYMSYASLFGDEGEGQKYRRRRAHSMELGQYTFDELLTQRKELISSLSEKIIEVENLTFAYDDSGSGSETKRAIEGISFTVKRGEFVAIIGKNGSGKSTLAKNFNALYIPTEGRVMVDGNDTRDPNVLWDIRQTVGMVFQNPDNQQVASIVEDDVAFGPENLGVPRAEIAMRIEKSLEAVGMLKHRKTATHLLSGGQKQRIAIAGVLAMKPGCIVFDEPTAMLDPKGREAVMDTVKALRNEGITVVLITHFMEEAVDADRIIVMDSGKIVLEGTPMEVFDNVELLRKFNLDIPPVVELRHRLAGHGIAIPRDLLTIKDMVEYICQ